LVLLGEGSNAEQMRDSGKIITTARQDKLDIDKLSAEGINFAFSRQTSVHHTSSLDFVNTAFGNMRKLL
jgi:hypothetical protein